MSQGKPKNDDFDFDSQWESLLNDSMGLAPPTTSKQHGDLPEEQQGVTLTEESTESESEIEEDEDEENEREDINPEDIKLDSFNEKLSILLIQMEDIRKKYIKEVESRRRAELANKDLMFKVADLEEENVEYQGTVDLAPCC